jgi:hypothetical protein
VAKDLKKMERGKKKGFELKQIIEGERGRA